MTQFLAHRVNSLTHLRELACFDGIEIDVRDYEGQIFLSHDPFQDVHSLCQFNCEFLNCLNPRSLIVNVKSERIENKVLELIKTSEFTGDWFFLDSSFSMLVSQGRRLPFAARLSEYEPIELGQLLYSQGLIQWLWIDTFTKLPLSKRTVAWIKDCGIKTCLTSPDLLGRPNDIVPYSHIMRRLDFRPDAICCKFSNIGLWRRLLNKDGPCENSIINHRCNHNREQPGQLYIDSNSM